MKEKVYVDRLFADYEDTPEIRDFKEEIAGNLKERVKELLSKGLDEEKAFERAAAELGDITAIADDVGKKKRNETISQMYMGAKVPLTKKTAAGITAASGLLMLGAGLALITFLRKTGNAQPYYISAAMLSVAFGLYAYFGLTQETAAHYPMKSGRALAYGGVWLIGFLVAGLCFVSFVFDGFEMSAALGIKMALILPAVCALIFLLATETKRRKPWLKAMIEHEIENSVKFQTDMVDPMRAARFGVASGGLWILAIAVFITLGVIISWQYSWLVFLFALAVQVFMTASIFGGNNYKKP
ncbi:MAG: permease prefix domain 1-containing protein [Oscillospiraceae bacterium]|nr:permease prefix domain 1-containing protein [Oscillospiraceae bacterium]